MKEKNPIVSILIVIRKMGTLSGLGESSYRIQSQLKRKMNFRILTTLPWMSLIFSLEDQNWLMMFFLFLLH